MTPKEKAIELYNKMYETGFKPKSVLIRTEQAKECALIAVDEIINASPIEPMIFLNGMRSTIPYWQEVKKEIEAL
jgi:uncharacterized protein YdaT